MLRRDTVTGAFFASFVVGLAVAAPLGPVGVLCIERTLRGGIPLGLACGLGVATADGLYAGVAALGLSAVARAVTIVLQPLQAAGGAVLLWLAWRTWTRRRSALVAREGPPSASGLLGAYGGTFALTLANPATILSFAAIMAGLGATVANPASGGVFVAGIAAGSLCWWVLLALGIGFARSRVPDSLVAALCGASAIVFAVAGIVVLARVVADTVV